MENKEITELLRVFKTTLGHDLMNIESITTGSDYKTKEEILSAATSSAREARRFLYLLTGCLEYLNEGFSFDRWIDSQLDKINNTNQPEQDRLDYLEDLNRLKEHFTYVF